NVLLGLDGRVKLADLGIASVPDDTRITTAGTVLGSFRYMAPEQLKEGPVTRATDIYALATVAFEVLCGRQARREENALAVAHAIASQPPPDIREIWPEAPAAVAEAIKCGMCRDPAGRPASAGALVGELEAALVPEHAAPMLAPGPGPRRPPRALTPPPIPAPSTLTSERPPRVSTAATAAGAGPGDTRTYRTRTLPG